MDRLLRGAASQDGAKDGLVRILRQALAELTGTTAAGEALDADEIFASDEEIFAFLDEQA